jgi:hypothetical protein
MKKPLLFRFRSSKRRQGVALVIVLAFVVIMTGVIIAYFSRSLSNRQISDASASQTKVSLFGQGTQDTIIANLQAEIVLSSSSLTMVTGTGTAYIPSTPAALEPQMSGDNSSLVSGTNWAPNFIARSANGQNFYTGGSGKSIPSSAVAVSSTLPSINGRSISMARWNTSYMLPLQPSPTDTTPQQGTFAPPDWVNVARDGSNPTGSNPQTANAAWSGTNGTTVIGRYAYVIYNEGGMLDANVAGFPSTTSTNTTGAYKAGLAYADLRQLPGGFNNNQLHVDQMVAWRNAASAQPSSTYNTAGSGPFGTSGQFPVSPQGTTSSGSTYSNYVNGNQNGYMTTSGTDLNNNGIPGTSNGSSDKYFASRQELISFLKNGLGFTGSDLGALNYLGTFSRGLNQPVFSPDPSRPKVVSGGANNGGNNAVGLDNQINPSFLAVRVTGTGFQRNDGSNALAGDPLVKTRFALSRLAWITYLGPSATRASDSAVTGNTSPGTSNKDYDLWALVHLYGVPQSYLEQGTSQNIQKYFGLQWELDSTNNVGGRSGAAATFHDSQNKWFYTGHNETGGSTSGQSSGAVVTATAGSISRIEDIAGSNSGGREPDFFELLKASVMCGSKAKSSINDGTALTDNKNNGGAYNPICYQWKPDTSLDYSIIQLGANIIDEAKVDGYSTRIVFNDGNSSDSVQEFRGAENLPYIYRTQSGTFKLRSESVTGGTGHETDYPTASIQDSGVVVVTETPVVWNVYDADSPLGTPGPAGASTSSTNFRCVVDSTYPDGIQLTGSTTGYNFMGGIGACQQPTVSGTSITAAQLAANQKVYTTTKGGSTAIPGGVGAYPGTNWTQAPAATGGYAGSYALDAMTPANSALNFGITNNTMFREPTPLAMAGFPSGSNLTMSAPVHIFQYNKIAGASGNAWVPTTSSTATGAFTCAVNNPLDVFGGAPGGNTQQYVMFCCGLLPEYWYGPAQTTGSMGVYQSVVGALATPPGTNGTFLTIRMQYRDPNTSGNPGSTGWVTYDTKYIFVDTLFMGTTAGTTQGNLSDQADGAQGGDWATFVDPRTARFSAFNGRDLTNPVQTPGGSGEAGEWSDPSNGAEVSDRPDNNAGYSVSVSRSLSPGSPIWEFDSMAAAGFIDTNSHIVAGGGQGSGGHFHMGMLSQNNSAAVDNGIRFNGDGSPVSGEGPMYYTDPDGVDRLAMGGYVPTGGSGAPASTTGTVGLPMAKAYIKGYSVGGSSETGNNGYQGQARPYFLHRPFRSVGELGYVFSGTPWKNIDFFTPQSGDAGLMDVFCVNEPTTPPNSTQPLVAGVVDLNTKNEPVLQAILTGAYTDEALSSGTLRTQFPPLGSTEVSSFLTTTSGTSVGLVKLTGTSPLTSPADLVGRWDNTTNGYTGFSGYIGDLYSASLASSRGSTITKMQYIDRFREAPLRALSNVANTRVWNLMIDVIAQTGRYPTGASSAQNFEVDGEQRYWVHVAIDRYTGQVLDKQVETVKE